MASQDQGGPSGGSDSEKKREKDQLSLTANRDDQDEWTLSEQDNRPIGSQVKQQVAEFNVPLPNGAAITIRLSRDVRLPEDGEKSTRLVLRFPAPVEQTQDVGEQRTEPENDSNAKQ